MLANAVEVGVVLFEQFGKDVLDLDVIICPGKTEPGRSLKCVSRSVVQPPD
jgi:hypothetical protein